MHKLCRANTQTEPSNPCRAGGAHRTSSYSVSGSGRYPVDAVEMVLRAVWRIGTALSVRSCGTDAPLPCICIHAETI